MKTHASLFVFSILLGIQLSAAAGEAVQSPGDFIEVDKAIPGLVIELAYAGTANVFGKRFYSSNRCFLRRGTVEKLCAAQTDFGKLGFRLKILDGYRPLAVQQQLWEAKPDARFVAPPTKGSRHNRGAAVDVTLVDETGRELVMPTAFDDFSDKAAASSPLVTGEALKNRTTLQQIMKRHGFVPLTSEWWHFDDANWQSFPIANVSFEELLKSPRIAPVSDVAAPNLIPSK